MSEWIGKRSAQVLRCHRIMTMLGDDVTSLLGNAQHDALIVAPFMRSEALSRLLSSIPVGTEPESLLDGGRPTCLRALLTSASMI